MPKPLADTTNQCASNLFDKTRQETDVLQSPGRRTLLAAGVATLLANACSMSGVADTPGLVQGVVWQPDTDHINPHGSWDLLGVNSLLVQWTAVDDLSFLSTGNDDVTGLKQLKRTPDWSRISDEPWARNVIVGLAGYFDEHKARTNIPKLVAQSKILAARRPPVHIDGYYFPVEIDPTWQDAASLVPLLNELPRPLWISVYDNSNIGGTTLARVLDSWLPRDVGVFFQDGCGVYARGPIAARSYADAMAALLGKKRVQIIAEAFRPAVGGGFRPATAEELLPQLLAYQGHKTWMFDGPHYVSNQLVQDLLKAWQKHT
jgi:hypothetical protein